MDSGLTLVLIQHLRPDAQDVAIELMGVVEGDRIPRACMDGSVH